MAIFPPDATFLSVVSGIALCLGCIGKKDYLRAHINRDALYVNEKLGVG
jgi:hypothetical protein